MKKNLIFLGTLLTVLLFVVSVFTFVPQEVKASWTEGEIHPTNWWSSVTSSSDGIKLIATDSGGGWGGGYIYISPNGGFSWHACVQSYLKKWTSVATSSDGKKTVAIASSDGSEDGYIYTLNSNYCSTWTKTNAGLRKWSYVASSSDGTKLVAGVSPGYIYTSTDSGATWTQRTGAGVRMWTSIASSSDGNKLTAVSTNGGDGTATFVGYIYTSTDSGATWTQRTGAGSLNWSSVASSSDGTKLVAGVYLGYIYTSTDSGATWTQRTGAGSQTWISIASSADGNKLAIVGSGVNSFIYISNDGGVTWIKQPNVSGNWRSIASSSNGNKLTAVDFGGYIYTYTPDLPYINPTLTTSPATGIATNRATLGGNITATGGQNATTRGFNYGLTTAYGTNASDTGSYGTGAYTKLITDLACGTTYHFRSYATNSSGTGYGSDQVFSTIACAPGITVPTLTTQTASLITTNSAKLNGTITNKGGIDAYIRGFNYGLTTTYGTNTTETGSFGVSPFSKIITGLTCGTTYHYRSYATNLNGTGYGGDTTFTTNPCGYNLVIDPIPNEIVTPITEKPTAPNPTVIPTPTPTTTTPKTTTPTVNPKLDLAGNALGAYEKATSKTISSNNTNKIFTRNLSLGMIGQDVKALQVYLNTHGYPISKTGDGSLGKETTEFGKRTEALLMSFQKDNGIKADGIMGIATWERMK